MCLEDPFEVLRNRKLQSRRDWRIETEGGHASRCRRNSQLQEGKSDNVRLGNPRPFALRRHLHTGQRPQRIIH